MMGHISWLGMDLNVGHMAEINMLVLFKGLGRSLNMGHMAREEH